MCFGSENFEYEPNFIYKETISNEADCLSNCNTFDYYKDKNNDIILIISTINPSNFDNKEFFIKLINLNNNNEAIQKLQGHKERITSLKIFINPKTKEVIKFPVTFYVNQKIHNPIWDKSPPPVVDIVDKIVDK